MDKSTDLRVIKTRNLLYNTLIELMKDKSFEEIKVSDICSKALINRSTFYSHYSDKYELLVDLVDTMKKALVESLEKNKHYINTKEYYVEMIKILLDHLEDKKSTFCSIIINNRNSIVEDIIIDSVNRDIKNRIAKASASSFNVPSDIVSVFYLAAVAGVMVSWLKNDLKYEKQKIIDYLMVLISDDFFKN